MNIILSDYVVLSDRTVGECGTVFTSLKRYNSHRWFFSERWFSPKLLKYTGPGFFVETRRDHLLVFDTSGDRVDRIHQRDVFKVEDCFSGLRTVVTIDAGKDGWLLDLPCENAVAERLIRLARGLSVLQDMSTYYRVSPKHEGCKFMLVRGREPQEFAVIDPRTQKVVRAWVRQPFAYGAYIDMEEDIFFPTGDSI